MRLYLSSFRLGQHHEHLLQLAGNGRRTALIPNALDNISAEDRSEGLRRDLDELEAAGLAVEMLDLRQAGAVDSWPASMSCGSGAATSSCFDERWPTSARLASRQRVSSTGRSVMVRSCSSTATR